jgi:hypothetical protein
MCDGLWVGKGNFTTEQCGVFLGFELPQRGPRVMREPGRPAVAVRARKDITRERFLKFPFIGRGESCEIGVLPPVKGFAETLHPLRHRKVADAHLAQIAVKIAAKYVEKLLPDATSGAIVRTDPGQKKHEMKHNQIKSALHRIGHLIGAVKHGRAGLRHDGAIEVADGAIAGAGSKTTKDHKVNPSPQPIIPGRHKGGGLPFLDFGGTARCGRKQVGYEDVGQLGA